MGTRTSDPMDVSILEPLEPRLMLAAAYPSGLEQYLIELINHTRAHPADWAAFYNVALNEGSPTPAITPAAKQPLAVNPLIVAAAAGHSAWMSAANVYDHWGPNIGNYAGDRMEMEGYNFTGGWGWGENLDFIMDWQVNSIVGVPDLTHERFYVDEGVAGRGHRSSLLNPDFKEVGVGIFDGTLSGDEGFFITENFAYVTGDSFLTGVVYDDSAVLGNGFYTAGEGLGGVTVTAVRDGDGQTFGPAATWDAGGYTLQVPDGTYRVIFSGGGLPRDIKFSGVVVGGENVKVDLDRSNLPDSPDLAILAPQPSTVYSRPGATVEAQVRTRNLGARAAGGAFDVVLYLSADTVVTTGDTNVGTGNLANLAARTTRTDTIAFTAPAGPGTYYLAALADPGAAVDEIDETNNWGNVFTLVVGAPDLVGAFGKVRLPSTIVPGDKGSVAVTVSNTGDIPAAGAVVVNVYAAENADLTGQSYLLAAATKSVNLAPGTGAAARTTVNMQVEISDAVPAGSWFLVTEVDVADAVAESDETNNLAAEATPRDLKWAFGTFDDRKGAKLTVRDALGTPVTFSMGGAGWGEILGGSAFLELLGHDTTERSSLKIASKAPTEVVDITIDGHIKSITGKLTALAGDLDVGGGLKALTLADVAADHRIDIHTDAGLLVGSKTQLAIKMGRVTDCIIDSPDVPIKSLTVIDWRDSDGTDSITAPRLGKLTATGRKANKKTGAPAVAGDFAANLVLTDAAAKATLGGAKIAGDLLANLWDIAGAMGALTVTGAARGAAWDDPLTVRAAGSIKGITLGAVVHADFLAGVGPIGGRRPVAAGDFADPSVTIKSVKIKPRKLATGTPYPDLFIDANFCAPTIGKAAIANADFTNDGRLFGFWARHQGTGKEIGGVRYKDLNDKTRNWSWPKTLAAPPPDMTISLL